MTGTKAGKTGCYTALGKDRIFPVVPVQGCVQSYFAPKPFGVLNEACTACIDRAASTEIMLEVIGAPAPPTLLTRMFVVPEVLPDITSMSVAEASSPNTESIRNSPPLPE